MKVMLAIIALARAGDGCGSSSPATAGSAGSDQVAAALDRFAAGSGSASTAAALERFAAGSAGSATGSGTVAKKPAAKPAGNEPHFDGRGPRRSKAWMMGVLEFENSKDTWDNGSVRREHAMSYYGDILLAYRCDNRDGCGKHGAGPGWTPVGWYVY